MVAIATGAFTPAPVYPELGESGVPELDNSVTLEFPEFETQTFPRPSMEIAEGEFSPPPVYAGATAVPALVSSVTLLPPRLAIHVCPLESTAMETGILMPPAVKGAATGAPSGESSTTFPALAVVQLALPQLAIQAFPCASMATAFGLLNAPAVY